MWLNNNDLDIATDATPDEMKSVLKVVKEVWKKYWTMIVSEKWKAYECTTFREDIGILNNRKPVSVKFTNDIKKDAERRDFTINAIYFDIENEEFFSPEWGIEDVKDKIIRFVWNPEERLEEDVLRMLRFVRFKFKYGLKSDKNLEKTFKKHAKNLKNISKERIKIELDKILMLEKNVEAFEFMLSVWILDVILPDLAELKNVPWWPPYHLEWDVFVHTMMCLSSLSKESSDLTLRYGVLFHDLGKKATFKMDLDRPRYNWHALYSAKMFKKIAKQYRFSNSEISKIDYLIYNHLKICDIFNMKKTTSWRFMMEKYFEDLLKLYKADSEGKIPSWIEDYKKVSEKYRKFLKEIKKVKLKTWKDIIKMYPSAQNKTIWELIKSENNKIFNSLDF